MARVETEDHGSTRRLRLNRPETPNARSHDVIDLLMARLARFLGGDRCAEPPERRRAPSLAASP
jgi:enoyl-CoA hydratase/carnithine racemase|tara:strand:+ start:192 stop:383 length:192 start_codon:yes stop_codon:yes gene_type:complete